MGVDIGSSTSKCVIMRFGADIVSSAAMPYSEDTAPSAKTNSTADTGSAIRTHSDADIVSSAVCQGGTGTGGTDRAVETALNSIGLSMDSITFTVATGYGRNSFEPAGKTYSELSCHALGAVHLCPDVRTVIDIGGQDCKAMQLTENGKLDGFVMNDKCAAGTGRFLEVMARILDVELNEFGDLSSRAESVIDITSTCTVFAESEVISQLAKGADRCSLIAGIHRSVAVKASSIAKRLKIANPVFFTGGVSQNKGVVAALSKELGTVVKTDPHAQLAGAIGAALLARMELGTRD